MRLSSYPHTGIGYVVTGTLPAKPEAATSILVRTYRAAANLVLENLHKQLVEFLGVLLLIGRQAQALNQRRGIDVAVRIACIVSVAVNFFASTAQDV
jgi:hypothetical protein